jgi:hypothetical protein
MRLLRPDTRIEKISVKYLFLNKKIIFDTNRISKWISNYYVVIWITSYVFFYNIVDFFRIVLSLKNMWQSSLEHELSHLFVSISLFQLESFRIGLRNIIPQFGVFMLPNTTHRDTAGNTTFDSIWCNILKIGSYYIIGSNPQSFCSIKCIGRTIMDSSITNSCSHKEALLVNSPFKMFNIRKYFFFYTTFGSTFKR